MEYNMYETSSAQKRLYLINNLLGDSILYNIPTIKLIEGQLDHQKLHRALYLLTERHEGLRTSFVEKEGEVLQVVWDTPKLDFQIKDKSRKVTDELIDEFIRPFEFAKAPLWRAELVKLDTQKYLFLFDIHHIIADAVTVNVIFEELLTLYQGHTLPPLEFQYVDYTIWQNDQLSEININKQEEYWLKQFSDGVPLLGLPLDAARRTEDYSGGIVSIELDKTLVNQLLALSSKYNVTLYMVLLSVYSILLAKYSEQDDVVIGTPIAGRTHPEFERIVGMFVNTLALRQKPAGHKHFTEYLEEVANNTFNTLDNQDYPFEMLVEKLNPERIRGRNPIFDACFAMQNSQSTDIEITDFKLSSYPYQQKIAKFDLSLYAHQQDNNLRIDIEYRKSLFFRETVERMLLHFLKIAKVVCDNPHICIDEINMLSEEEERTLIYSFNKSHIKSPKGQTIDRLFEQQVEKTPDKNAIIFEGSSLTYRELNERANQLARILRKKGVKADSVVGIMATPSIEMMVGILAILKSGGAYLSIDSATPLERVEYLLRDSGALLFLVPSNDTCELVEKMHSNFPINTLFLNDPTLYFGETKNLEKINNEKNLMYIIYTSGSTGMPKGVMVEHQAVTRFVKNPGSFTVSQEDRVLQTCSLAFDVSVYEIWGTLLLGATLYLITKEELLNARQLDNHIKRYDITIAWFTAPLLNQLVDENLSIFENLRLLISGGDTLSPRHINLLRSEYPNLTIINGYGPSESTIFTTFHTIQKEYEKNIPIGKPLPNTEVYILNSLNQPQPIGVPGELCIGGEGLARGYLSQPDLTKEKFVPNPINGQRMYRSGDRARWLADGTIEFLGRMDKQVKIRGYRIEIGEIETAIGNVSNVKEAIVTVHIDEQEGKNLCAYIVGEVLPSELRKEISKTLPDYMIPTYIIPMSNFPLSTSGKVDRKALPAPNSVDKDHNNYDLPETLIEKKLSEMWSEVLGHTTIGVNENFFSLGGHSLLAVSLLGKVHLEMGVNFTLSNLFDHPTIREMAGLIESSELQKVDTIPIASKQLYYEVSSAQKSMYLLHEMGSQTTYNIPLGFRFKGEINVKQLEKAIYELVKRHESLRTSFSVVDGKIVQIIHPQEEVIIEFEDLKITNVDDENLDETVMDLFIRPFDLSKTPLIRIGIVETGDQSLVLFDMHHIISDGVSVDILMHEFIKYYSGEYVEPLRRQYKDFAVWQNEIANSEIMKEKEEYWLNQFKSEIPVLSLLTDSPRNPGFSFEGGTSSVTLDGVLVNSLKHLANKNNVSLFMLFLSAYNVLLSKYSGQDDIIVGTPVSGRTHPDVAKTIGLFVNTLALRNFPSANKNFADFLKEVRSNVLDAHEHQDYPIEKLVENLNLSRDRSLHPLFSTLFVMERAAKVDDDNLGLNITPIEHKMKTAKLDLMFAITEDEKELTLFIQYRSDLFLKDTINKMASKFIYLLELISQYPYEKIENLSILPKEEQQTMLLDFNNTSIDFPRGETIHRLFEKQAEKTPHKNAIVFKNASLTYAELNTRANQLARILKAKGVKADSVVGVLAEPSFEMVVGILAILKAGGAYLPLDPSYPKERLRYLLKDSQAHLCLIQRNDYHFKTKMEEVSTPSCETIFLNDQTLFTGDIKNLQGSSSSRDLVYIIYTSGSTGKPKGVMVEHQAITRFVLEPGSFTVSPEDKVLQTGSQVFDISVYELWGTLLKGATLYLIQKEELLNARDLSNYMDNYGITIAWFTAPLLHQLVDESLSIFKRLRLLISGGDTLSPRHVNLLRAEHPKLTIINAYGPSESGIFTTFQVIQETYEKNIPIGKPIPNTEVYILNHFKQLQPIGLPGELCIGGEGLARGYLSRPDLTEEKFVPNPFKNGERMYRSGDSARWLDDGTIEFLGRLDKQVKIRGFRIEIAEIETIISKVNGIKEAVVIDRVDTNGEKYLCAYYTIMTKSDTLKTNLREELSKLLPDYMIPSYFVRLLQLPLNINGKIDRSNLPEPTDENCVGINYVSPSNKYEEKLAEIWSELLGLVRVSVLDDFFTLGGSSLKASKMVSLFYKKTGVDIPLSQVFLYPTIRQLASLYSAQNKSQHSSRDEKILLLKPSGGQDEHFFFIHDGSGDISGYLDIVKELDSDRNYWGIKADFDVLNDTSIEKIASSYIKKLKTVQPEGPYFITGWSLGGTIAFEMTRQLEMNQEIVAFLTIIDSPVPQRNNANEANLDKELNMLENMNIDFSYWKKTFPKEAIPLIPNFYQLTEEELIFRLSILNKWIKAQQKYYPQQAVMSKIYLFSTKQSLKCLEKGWGFHCNEKIKSFKISGDHFTMVKFPNSIRISNVINEELKNFNKVKSI
ncbi:amino acid adenylation domain-containing protein [Bacillus idriensis]|uniref:Amino acid adenylation domain-containing protein n=1 Tax=Metabacillus idriensis TaxID=324768 RepID=A0A6I2MD20_9BACI|nr:non-ribosomal peptide synthetase [Metabacillus idriensis]MRX56180.1 amino acid adenylation domain-containing protein [Metabacillus idriensis]